MTEQIQSFLLLTALSLAYSHCLRWKEVLRRAVVSDRVPDMLGVWTFAGTMLLPAPLIVALVIVVNLGEWPSRRAVGNGRPLKYAVSTVGTAASCLLACYVLHRPALGMLAIPAAVLTFWATNISIVAALIRASGKRHVWRMLAAVPRAHLVEVGTQAMGAGLGLAMAWHQATAVAVLPILFAVHLGALRHTVQAEHAFDAELGLWSELAWRVQVQQRLYDLPGQVALLIIDPDQAGQQRQILQAIASGLGPADLLGHYGTRQIVALIAVGRPEAGAFLSTGFRADLAAAGVQAALGCATTADSDLEGLLVAAMSDLMRRRAAAGINRSW
ncbi:hypothetical protein [Jatrophihabitans sp.]|uniref:hypothetical protein n=1 Tax=Jatrophihabitans sp. TaxID=1932789 RepID=UPI002CACFE06|nr:hypothetical protein [Jatrophihabitans sp.]